VYAYQAVLRPTLLEGRMRRSRFARIGGALILASILVVLSLLTPVAAPTATGSTHATASVGADRGAVPPSLGTSPGLPPCPAPLAVWGSLYSGLWAPPGVDPAQQGPCAVGADENALSLLSNVSGSGARTSLAFALPPAGSAVGSALAAFSVRLWVSGVPCSIDQASVVEIQLVPPMSPFLSAPQLNWTVRAPAYDLVAPASCDPTCSNDTAAVTFEGAAVCEDQIVRAGPGGPPLDPAGSFAPGDTVTVTFVGAPGGSEGLGVYVNGSSHPGGDLAFRYDAGSILTGNALEPLFATSSLDGFVWGSSAALAVVATHCPIAWSPLAACDSYDASLWSGLPPVRLLDAEVWNATSGAYDVPYDGVATASSTGACATGPIECSGGGGPPPGVFYPSWALHGDAGAAYWTYGSHYRSEVLALAGDAGPSNGTEPGYTIPAAVGAPATSVAVASFNVTLRVTDPAGVARVAVAADYCTSAASTAPTVVNATLEPGPMNSARDGNWTAPFPIGSFHGTYPLWVQVWSAASVLLGASSGSVTIPGGSTSCLLLPPSAPTAGLPFAAPTAGGYLVRWSDHDPAVVGFTVNATDPNGSNRSFSVGDVDAARIDLGVANVSFNLSVAARYGANLTSPFTPPVAAAPTAFPFTFQVAPLPSAPLWLGGPPLNVSGTVGGGVGPFLVTINFGDGATATLPTAATFSVTHDFLPFCGDARTRVSVADAAGDTASAGPFLLAVWGTPLASASSAIGGDSIVEIQWHVPPSPAAPVTGARVFYSTDVAMAAVLARVDSNATVPGLSVWNITNLTHNLLFVPVDNGLTLYAQVVAMNAFGLGQLPSGPPNLLVARTAPLVLSPITAVAGGGAPFTDNFSAEIAGGSNDTIASAFYSFPSGAVSAATMTYVNGTTYLNATHTFPSPGSFVVVLHATDALFETVIDTTTVFVASGAPPGLTAVVVNGPAYAGGTVDFEATATGGSGNYSFNWSFGDGTSANGTNAVHTFPVSGEYSVLVSVVDAVTGGASSIVVPVIVYSLPVIFVSVTPGPNGSLSYDLRASVGGGSGPSSVVWSFGDGTVARGAVVSHDYREPGTYPVNVTATDPAGRSGIAAFNLTANPAPNAGGGVGSTGITVLELILAGVAAVLLATTLYFGSKSRPAPEPPQEPPGDEEDGEVSLT